jgi:hypothetical protein
MRIMDFWSTKSLNNELRRGPLSNRDRHKYLLGWAVIVVLVILSVHRERISRSAAIDVGFDSIVLVLFISLCRRANRKGDDRDFFGRFIGISFLEALKCGIVSFLLAYASFTFALPIFATYILSEIVLLLFCWRVYKSIVSISARRRDAGNKMSDNPASD